MNDLRVVAFITRVDWKQERRALDSKHKCPAHGTGLMALKVC